MPFNFRDDFNLAQTKSERKSTKINEQIKAKVSLQIVLLSLLRQYPGRYSCNSFQLQHPFQNPQFFHLHFITYCTSRNLMMRKSICICFPIICTLWCPVMALIIMWNTTYRRNNNNIEHATFFFLIRETILMSVYIPKNCITHLAYFSNFCSNPCLSLYINKIMKWTSSPLLWH